MNPWNTKENIITQFSKQANVTEFIATTGHVILKFIVLKFSF